MATPSPLSLTLSCAGAATLSSAYWVVWLTRNDIPTGDLPPLFTTTLHTLITSDTNIADWGAGPALPSPTKGTWNAASTYAVGDTVASALYSIKNSAGVVLYPIVYRSLQNGNTGHSPEAWDGWWTCITQPSGDINANFVTCPFGYLLSPLPSQSDLSSTSWVGSFGHSLSWTVTAPGDVIQLIDLFVKLNYLLGSSIVSTYSRPLSASATTGSQGLIANPGTNAQFQCWHSSGLSSAPALTLSGFDLSAFVSGFQPGSTVGTSYLSALTASGGTPPYAYAIIAGSLPPGIQLNGTTGVISGVATGSGVFDFTAQVTDNTGATATASCAAPVQCGGAAQGNAFY